MSEYAYRGVDGDGKPIRVRSVGDTPEQVLVEARAARHHVVMLYKLLPTEARYEPLLAAANFPLPHILSKSVFRRFDRRSAPVMLGYGGKAWRVLRAAIRNGTIHGQAGWFTTRVHTDSLIQAAVRALMDYTSKMATNDPEQAMTTEEQEVWCAQPSIPASESWEGTAAGLPHLPTLHPYNGRVNAFLSICYDPLMAPGAGFRCAPFLFARLCLYQAFVEHARGLRWYRDTESSRCEILFEDAPPRQLNPVPREMHAAELLVFTGMVGISPTTLPPASGQNTLRFGSEQYTFCGKTRLTDAGEDVELRWSKIPA